MTDVHEYLVRPEGDRAQAPAAAGLAIATRGLVRRFGDHAAVDGIDLAVARGEIYGFLGPNGAGKSTLLRMLCTLLRPSEGTAVVAGHDVVHEPQEVRFRIGVALQAAALDDGQTGRELLALQGRLYGLTKAEIRVRFVDVLELVDIGPAIDQRIGTYSGGMKRRLDLAAALMHNPEILFLDEPTTGLDPTSRQKVWSEIRHLNDELGMTIFLTTQYLEEADDLAHRVGIISKGRVVAEGSPEALKRAVGHDQIVVELDGDDPRVMDALRQLDVVEDVTMDERTMTVGASDGSRALNQVAVTLSRMNVSVNSLVVRKPTLDDVFRQLTGEALDLEESVAAGNGGDR